jgi:hypothetical protein
VDDSWLYNEEMSSLDFCVRGMASGSPHGNTQNTRWALSMEGDTRTSTPTPTPTPALEVPDTPLQSAFCIVRVFTRTVQHCQVPSSNIQRTTDNVQNPGSGCCATRVGAGLHQPRMHCSIAQSKRRANESRCTCLARDAHGGAG